MCTGSGSFFKGVDCHWLKMDFQCNLTGSDIHKKEGSLRERLDTLVTDCISIAI